MWSGKPSWQTAQQPNSNSGQVDWAALAQAWIQQKASGDQNAGAMQEHVSVPDRLNNTGPPQHVMPPNICMPHPMQWQQPHRPPWQNTQMNPPQNWGMTMYQQPRQDWHRPMQPEHLEHKNMEPRQWQGNQNGQWCDTGPPNGIPLMQQNMGNMENIMTEPPQPSGSFHGPDNHAGNGRGGFDNIQPPPPLPDLPPPNHQHMHGMQNEMPHDSIETNRNEQQQRHHLLDNYPDQLDYHHAQKQDFYEPPDHNQWMGDDHNPQWVDGGDNWSGHQQTSWPKQDEGDVVPPLLGQPVFENDDHEKMDAAKQRKLPRWLREGLEKMEKEKQKKMEREEHLKKARFEEDTQLEESKDPLKSKFDSDGDDSEAELSDASRDEPIKSDESEKSESESDVECEEEKSEEEKQMELMMKVRRMLTEILLDVTNSEAHGVAEEVFVKGKKKAQANAIAKPNSSTSQFGLIAGYGSESEGESEYENDAEDDSENEDVQKKIERKTKIFHIRQQEVLRALEDEEEQRTSAKLHGKLGVLAESSENRLVDLEHEPKSIQDNEASETLSPIASAPNIEPKLRSRSTSSSTSSSGTSPVTTVTLQSKSVSTKERSSPSHSRSPSQDRMKHHQSISKKKSDKRSRSRDRSDSKDSKRRHKSTRRRSRSRDRKRSERKRSRSRSRRESQSPKKYSSRRDSRRSRLSRDRSKSREGRKRSRERKGKRSRSRDKSERKRSSSPTRKKKKHRSSSSERMSDAGKSSKAKSKSKLGKKGKKKRKHSSSDSESDSSYGRKGKTSIGKRRRRKQSR